jgi:hypothetical protein
MATLLQIYESYENGQGKQFIQQVREYGEADFAIDVQTEINDGVLNYEQGFRRIKTIIVTNYMENYASKKTL